METWLFTFSLLLGVYTLANGFLHDFFVARKHTGAYSRDLMRLLIDGHVLITCGSLYLVAAFLLKENMLAAYLISLVSAVSMIIYCLLIFPFLKSIVTLSLNIIMLVIILYLLFTS